jgi:hypothetical protein
MNLETGTVQPTQLLSYEYLFRIFGIVSLQYTSAFKYCILLEAVGLKSYLSWLKAGYTAVLRWPIVTVLKLN